MPVKSNHLFWRLATSHQRGDVVIKDLCFTVAACLIRGVLYSSGRVFSQRSAGQDVEMVSAQALERVFTVQDPDLVDTCMYDFVLLSEKNSFV